MAGTVDISSSVSVFSGLPESALAGPDVRDSGLRQALGQLAPVGRVGEAASLASDTLTIPKGFWFLPLGPDASVLVEAPELDVTLLDGEEILIRAVVNAGADPVISVVTQTNGGSVGPNDLRLGSRSSSTFTPDPDSQLAKPGRTIVTGVLDGTDFAAGNTVTIPSPVAGRVRRLKLQVRTAITVSDSDVDIAINGGTAFGDTTVTVAASAPGDDFDSGEIADSANNQLQVGDDIEVQSDGDAGAGVVNFAIEIE